MIRFENVSITRGPHDIVDHLWLTIHAGVEDANGKRGDCPATPVATVGNDKIDAGVEV